MKDRFYTEAAAEYGKRLSRFCTLNICEVADRPAPDNATPGQQRLVRQSEGEGLLSQIRERDHVIALCVDGPQRTSEAFAAQLKSLMDSGKSSIVFVIGGSIGLSEQVLTRADETLSLSKMTLPHRLCRVMLLEQLYRAFKINANEPYHK